MGKSSGLWTVPETVSGTLAEAMLPAFTSALIRPDSSFFDDIVTFPLAASAPEATLSCVKRNAPPSISNCPDNSSNRVSPPVGALLSRLPAAFCISTP